MGLIRYFAALIVFLSVTESIGRSLSVNHYNAFKQLETALLNGNTSSVPNKDILIDTFFPKQRSEPLCASIQYHLDDALSLEVSNHSFLWTSSYLSFTTGVLLLSFSQSGITLKGFEWENSCLFTDKTELQLELSSFNYSYDVIEQSLGDLTSQLKAYAEATDIPKVSSSYRGFAINWENRGSELHRMDTIFIIYIILLNIFIVCSALASSNFLYKKLYANIQGKTNPGYAFFWAIVFLSLVWNVGPSWLVLAKYGYKVYCSLVVVIPLQLVVAILVTKKARFPIPGPWYNTNHSNQCADDIRNLRIDFFQCSLRKEVFQCCRCLLSHIVQVLSIWSLLITFTFFVHYLTSVIVALYLDPLNSLVKLAFIKAILVCFIINTALLFVVDTFMLKYNKKGLQAAALSLVSILAILCGLPVLVFFLFTIGGIVFADTSNSNSWKPIFTLIPSLLIVGASWFSHGHLFPKGESGKGLSEIVHAVEGDPTELPSPTGDDAVSKSSIHTKIAMDEATPLLT